MVFSQSSLQSSIVILCHLFTRAMYTRLTSHSITYYRMLGLHALNKSENTSMITDWYPIPVLVLMHHHIITDIKKDKNVHVSLPSSNGLIQFQLVSPRKASTRQLMPLMALKKIWGSCLRQGCWITSWGTLLTPSSCSWNLGVELTITGLLRSTGLLMEKKDKIVITEIFMQKYSQIQSHICQTKILFSSIAKTEKKTPFQMENCV